MRKLSSLPTCDWHQGCLQQKPAAHCVATSVIRGRGGALNVHGERGSAAWVWLRRMTLGWFGGCWFFFMFAEAYGGKQDESQKMSSIMARHQQGFVGNQFLSGVMKLRVTLLHCRLPQHQSHDKTLGDNQPSPAASRQTRSGLPYYRSSRSLQAHGPGRRQHPPAAP